MDAKDYLKAKGQIEGAIGLIGDRALKPSLFEFFLRAGQITEKLSETEACLDYVRIARAGVEMWRRLRSADRSYLLDYCDLFEADACNSPYPPLRLSESEYASVTPRYRRQYPIIWPS